MRQQEYNEIQDATRVIWILLSILILASALAIVSNAKTNNCETNIIHEGQYINQPILISDGYWWCSYYGCYWVDTSYYEDNYIYIDAWIETITSRCEEPKEPKRTSFDFSYTFGKNDTDRYSILKQQNTTRSKYIMENIAWSYSLYPQEFEKKYGI